MNNNSKIMHGLTFYKKILVLDSCELFGNVILRLLDIINSKCLGEISVLQTIF